MMTNAKIGAAVLGGYLLGRTKKGKLALSLGAALAGSRMRPGQVGKLLEDSPVLGNVSKQVRTELTEAGRTAATTVLSAKAERLADVLHERTEGLHEKAHGKGGRGRAEADRDEDDEDGDRGGEDERGVEPRSRERRSEGREKKTKTGSARSRRPDDG
jgi:hypothetical protein